VQTPTWSRVLALLALLPGTALAADPAGVSAAVRGEVTLARAQAVGQTVRSGESIFMADKIRSGPRSGMQILLLDQTTFTIGPESELIVDEFVYDPHTNAGKLTARVAKGVFRFVTGKIAKQDPSNVNVALPAGSIGIRGTIVAGVADAVSRASLVVLLGEGPDNAAGDPAGAIDVCNAGACTHVERPGFGVRIAGIEARPSPAFRVKPDDVDTIVRAVNGTEEGLERATADAADEGVNPAAVVGDAPDLGKKLASETRRRLASLDDADAFTDLAAQDKTTEDVQELAMGPRLADGPSLFEQMKGIPNGQIHYFQTGVPLSGGSYDLSVNVDFGAQTYGGGQSKFQVNGLRSGTQLLPAPQSYAGATGPASFIFSTSAITGSGCGTNCTAQLSVFPQNSNGLVAGRALHNLVVKDMSGIVIDSGAGNAPGVAGLAP
jgi:hypothetical protein